MKIHTVELRHVRHIRTLALDLSGPLTIIGGPNGVGKSTLQQAILAAMFLTDKETRDSLVSRFDPDSPPTVVLGLSRGDANPTIELTRTLTDDKGQWKEGATLFKQKKQALDKIRDVLPISADAAALLLWGRQDDMTAVVEKFPSDGHTLLASATIKGSGPDPKKIIKELEKDIDNARKGERGGQVVGSLTQASNRAQGLEEELNKAKAAEAELQNRRLQFEQAKTSRDEIKTRFTATEDQINKLAQREKLLEPALHQLATLANMEDKLTDWTELDQEIEQSRKALEDLHKDLKLLQAQYRVARDEELGGHIENLQARIRAVAALEKALAAIETDLKSTKRPEAKDVEKYQELRKKIKEAEDKIEASGVRFELSIASGARRLRVAEDGAPEREIEVVAGQPCQGIVGHVAIVVDGLRVSAGGKEDIARHKRLAQEKSQEIQTLFGTFAALDEAEFLGLAREKVELSQETAKKRNEIKLELAAASLDALRTDLERLTEARTQNNMTLKDKEACAGKILPTAGDLGTWRAQKNGEISQAGEALAALEKKRPGAPDRALLASNLETVRKRTRESVAAFKDADESQREPSKELQEEVRNCLKESREKLAELSRALIEAERNVGECEGQLKQVAPLRSIDVIQAEWQEAKDALKREQVLQSARALLVERIKNKIADMTAHIPVGLGNKITEQLSRLTGGLLAQVTLDRDLAVAHIGENRAHPEQWQPRQLSHGERHQTALAVKIAVARALAESSGPVFIILDDSLVTFDPQRRAATEELLLDLVADGKLQVILVTCHTDWASGWKQRRPNDVHYLELAKLACYYRQTEASSLSPKPD